MKKKKPPARHVLVTGFPTFVARKLTRLILEREPDTTVKALVRPDHIEEAKARVAAYGPHAERVQLLPGDVVDIDLGLSGREFLELVESITDIYHIASIWYLGVDRSMIRDVNVIGARNILDAATEFKKLERLNHFSTAFVAGDRTGVIMEEDLDFGQTFRNAYEETKFEAEKLMRHAMRHLPITVYRPSLIVGDTDSGEIDKMAGPYYLMNAIVLMPSSVPILLPGKGDKPLNMVPIDFVCDALHHISVQEEAIGKTYHLTDPNPLSAQKVFEIVADLVGRPAPIGRFPWKITKLVLKFPMLEKVTRSQRQFIDDLNQLVIYNSINTVSEMEGRPGCPPFPSYASNLVEYIRNTEQFDVEMPDVNDLVL